MFEWAATMLSQGSSTGAIDVVAIRDSAGNLSCSPFHVKLSKLAKKGDSSRVVRLAVNSKDVALSMKLGGAGEAFFVERTDRNFIQSNAAIPIANPNSFDHDSASKEAAFSVLPVLRNKSSLTPAMSAVSEKLGINETRRRQRSFSDGDIDGDYKYLLDEQVIMAMSLCAPVSFHHEKEKGPTDANMRVEEEAKVKHGLQNLVAVIEPRHELNPISLNHSKENNPQISYTKILPDAFETPVIPLSTLDIPKKEDDSENTPKMSLKFDDEILTGRNKDIENPRRRSLSDTSQTETRSPAFQQPNEREREGGQLHSLSKDLTPSQDLGTADSKSKAPHSTAIRNAGTRPSWSWTWGALPVKSTTKSSADLLLMLENGCADPSGPPVIGALKDTLTSTTKSSVSDVINFDAAGAECAHPVTVQAASGSSDACRSPSSPTLKHSPTCISADQKVLMIATTKHDEEGNKKWRRDSIGNDQSDDDSLCDYSVSVTAPAAAVVPLFVGGDTQDHQSQNKNVTFSSDARDADFMVSSDQNTFDSSADSGSGAGTGAEKGLGYQWRDSFADLGHSTFSLSRSNNQYHKKAPAAQGSHPDLLTAFVKGDPSHGDMWKWDGPSEGLAEATGQTADCSLASGPQDEVVSIEIAKDDCQVDSLKQEYSEEVNAIGSSNIALNEVDGDGDTDQELDTLSLHDIPLDEISPEPAGGDFYDSDTESYLSLSLDDGDSGKATSRSKRKYRYRKVLVPSQEQLQSLDLCDGENEISFELQGQEGKGAYTSSATPLLRNQLFVWPHDAKVVIIDIEGAITAVSKGGKGWGMGGFLSAPRTAVHKGVAKLLTNIHSNGYRILYIAQSTSTALGTKEHLAKVAAGSDIKLPPGPVFQSPDSLIRAFGAARTDLFKAAALRGLKSLFPTGHNPYYACFGTRQCDMVAFSRCGVPQGRIFIVSPDTGEISGMNRTFRSSYEQVNEVLHEMFPAVSGCQSRDSRYQCASSVSSPTGPHSSSAPFGTVSASAPLSCRKNTCVSPVQTAAVSSMKSIGEATCSLAEDDYSDFNFWKLPHVAIV